jgi:hypothetical protein
MSETPDLISLIRQADLDGAIPAPIRGEHMNDYRLRVAHAGAVIGIAFCQQATPAPTPGQASGGS